jgi:hypothetical protein
MTDIGGPVYAVIVLIAAWFLYRAHRDPGIPFDLKDLLMENGRVSKIAVAFLVTLFTSSWYVVYGTLNKQLTDIAFGAYLAAWVAPIVAHIIKGGESSSTTTTSTSQTTEAKS